jgi:hypothetical protein
MHKIFLLLFFFLSFFALPVFAVSEKIPEKAFEGKIAEIHPQQKWLSVYSPYGILYLVLHPEGLVFKDGVRTTLGSFKVGDDIVAIPGGIYKENTLLILALEDWKTYHAKSGAFPHPFQQALSKIRSHHPKFLQINGEVAGLNPEAKTIFIKAENRGYVDVEVIPETKIYTYTKGNFWLLSLDKLWVGEWVRVGGFQHGKMLKAESILVLPGHPK